MEEEIDPRYTSIMWVITGNVRNDIPFVAGDLLLIIDLSGEGQKVLQFLFVDIMVRPIS